MNVLKFLVAMLFAYLFASFAHTSLTKARSNNMTTSIDHHKQALRSISKEMLRDDFNILKLKNQQGHRINCLKKEDLANPSFFNTKEQHLISAKKHRSDMITAFNKRVKTFVKLAKNLKTLVIKNLSQNESCDEALKRTAKDILVYYKIIDYAAHRAIICGSESGNTPMTQEKPDYDMIFCSDIDNPIMRKLYAKIELELGQNAETQEILTILNQMQTILRIYPKFCSEKWDLERIIEKLRQNNQFYINDLPNELLEQGLLYTATHIPDSRVKIGLNAEELSGGFVSVITNLLTNFNAALTNANETQEFENKEYETGNGKVTEYNIEEELEDEKEADIEDESELQLLYEAEADMQ